MSIIAAKLPFLSGGASAIASGCSAAGSVVVGSAFDSGGNPQAVYWDNANAIHLLPALDVILGDNAALRCSSDGGVIIGQSVDSGGLIHAVTWTGGPSWVVNDLGFLASGDSSSAQGCSADASVVVGESNIIASGASWPSVWSSGSATQLPTPDGATGGVASVCSAGGNIIFGGYVDDQGTSHPAMWTGGPSWAITELASLSGGLAPGQSTTVLGCSSDGARAVGHAADSGNNSNACFWNLGINVFAGPIGGPGSLASHCDASGLNVCGNAAAAGPDGFAAVWISGTGLYLPLFGGGISVDQTTGVSSDGIAIVGFGTDGDSSQVAVKWTGVPEPPPPPVINTNRGFLICGNNWTITAPLLRVYGLDHLIGRQVVGLADGVPVGPLTVQADGSVVLPFVASYITLGLSFIVQLQTPYLDTGNPTVQGRRKDITAVTVRVDASAAPMVGSNQPDGGSFTPTEIGPVWTNLQPTVTQDPEQFPRTYTTPAGATVNQLFSGDFRGNLQPGWDERGQIAVEQTLPLPLSITAVMPEVLVGDSPEQAIQSKQGGQGDDGQRGPGLWMITSRGRR